MTDTSAQAFRPFYGKYRGVVVDNLDPLFLGRILVQVPAVFGDLLNWCMPCTPFAGEGMGFVAIPPSGANVWVEFEGGDISYPIWVGCFWGEGQMPGVLGETFNPSIKIFRSDETIRIETASALSLVLNAADQSVSIKDSCGNALVMGHGGISLTSLGNISIKASGVLDMSGMVSVSIDSPADVAISGLNTSVRPPLAGG